MIAKLRGHHLICLNFFRGEGYSEDFISNIHSVIGKEKIEIVKGPDDVCAWCPFLKDDICNNPEYSNEMILLQDMEALRLLKFKPGIVVSWKEISDKLPGKIGEWKAQFCAGCGYRKICFGSG
ncbi:MAG: DUF1284 domain-containing protein [Euryarchaeota archaeon]|nr:DUF1284 domain-containing protein [Euryarchaeota archaeon]MBU4222625.1 DUF1284 domain-containing protein [Euryarchaeota archaeon]MBU4453853.1 DUF1284 domain-containing protein [Euryarchaeota archaeon]